MTNSNPTNGNRNLNVCDVCKQTGKRGAQWLVYVDGNPAPAHVHRPCGNLFIEQSPKEERGKIRLVPSRALRDEWARDRTASAARSLWEERFAKAKPLRKPGAVAAPTAGPVVTVTTPPPVTAVPAPAIAA